MRITNKMMNYDRLSNMNANKTSLDRLNSQMSTEKKITRLSDDPVIGVRALRLRSSLSEVTQYYGANVPDAVAWVDVTQKAIDSTVEILSGMKALCVQGANGTYDAASRTKIYEELKADVKQIYQNGNANYADRSVFTGYRTGESLTFKEDTSTDYRGIADGFSAGDLEVFTYTESPFSLDSINSLEIGRALGELDNEGKVVINGVTYTPTKDAQGHYSPITVGSLTLTVSDNGKILAPADGETNVKENRVNRIRLSYDNINSSVKTMQQVWQVTDVPAPAGDPNRNSSFTVGIGGKNFTIDALPEGGFEIYHYEGSKRYTPEELGMELGFSEKAGVGEPPVLRSTIYSSNETNLTKVVTRTPLNTMSVETGSVEKDDKGELQAFKLTDGKTPGTGYEIRLIPNGYGNGLADPVLHYGGSFQVVKHSASGYDVVNDTSVTTNSDGTFTVKIENPSGDVDVFNVSANGTQVLSSYKENTVDVPIVKSTDLLFRDDDGNFLNAYQVLALDPNGENSKVYYDADGVTSLGEAADAIYLLYDTGELVFGSNLAKEFSKLDDIEGVDMISVYYDKSSFEEGDLRPEHYFDCKQIEGSRGVADALVYDDHGQDVYYSVGSDQKIGININADELFDSQIIRQADDIIKAIEEYNETEDKVNRLKNMKENASSYSTEEMEKIDILIDAANKELDIAKNKLQSVYEKGIDAFGQYHYQATLASTSCGTINNRLTLINNRLQEEQSAVKTLASENENVDITHVAIEVSDAEQIYNSALMATGKIGQHTLLSYL